MPICLCVNYLLLGTALEKQVLRNETEVKVFEKEKQIMDPEIAKSE